MITLKEFLSFITCESRILIFDPDLITDDWWDDYDNNDPVVYFGDYGNVPDIYLSRLVRCCMVSDEYVNCLHIKLKERGDKNE